MRDDAINEDKKIPAQEDKTRERDEALREAEVEQFSRQAKLGIYEPFPFF